MSPVAIFFPWLLRLLVFSFTNGDNYSREMHNIMHEMKELKSEIQSEISMLKNEAAERDAEIASLKAVVDLASAREFREMPIVMGCAFQESWKERNTTLTYNHMLSFLTNAKQPGGGDGDFNIETGIFSCLTPGSYAITYGGHAFLNPHQSTALHLVHNEKRVFDSELYSDALTIGVTDQGSRTVVSIFYIYFNNIFGQKGILSKEKRSFLLNNVQKKRVGGSDLNITVLGVVLIFRMTQTIFVLHKTCICYQLIFSFTVSSPGAG